MRSRPMAFALILGVVLAACNDGGEDVDGGFSPESGRDVIEAMVQAHEDSRYRNLTFVQRTVTFGPDGVATDTSTWYEALAPGRLRIDVAPWRDGNGILYLHGLRYTIRAGEAVDSTRDINPLALLLADAFHQPAARTATVLDSLGFDLSVVREDRWEGEPTWVVGAPAGDTASSQFWIEQERLLPVRVVDQLESGPLLDARIGGYRQIDGSWVESRIDIRVGGRLAQTEEYRQIRVNPELPEGLFDPYGWRIAEPYWEPDRTGAVSSEEMGRVVRSVEELNSLREGLARSFLGDGGVEPDQETFGSVCKPVGQRAATLSRENGWTVQQLAVRFRNPAHRPDAAAERVHERMETEEDLVGLWRRDTMDGRPGLRYYRRITVREPCLRCHGSRESRPEFIVEGYPEDRAFGFEVGDLRGIYSVFVPADGGSGAGESSRSPGP